MIEESILITGGSGFIGTNLMEYYLQKGWKVVNLDIAPPRNMSQKPYWKYVDILNRDALLHVVSEFQPSFFLHFAARTDLDEKVGLKGYAANIEGVHNIIEIIKNVPSIQRTIFASSQLVYQIGYQPKHNTDYCPTTVYGKSKVLGEKAVLGAVGLNSCWSIVRPTSIWGPWFEVPYRDFFIAIARNLYTHPTGLQTLKQWGFVGNSVHQINMLINSPIEKVNKKIFYLADYEPIDLLDFANYVRYSLGMNPIRTIRNDWLLLIAKLGDLFQKIGWRNPPLTSFRYHNIVTNETQNLEPLRSIVNLLPYSTKQGIKNTLRWLQDQNLI